MLQILCFITSEDYLYLNSMGEKNIPVNFYAYTFEVDSVGEAEGGSSRVKVIVVELINANMALGFAVRNDMSIDGEFQLNFTSQDNPTNDIPIVCKLSKEVKRTSYTGDDIAKLEYLGLSLEKFYEGKGATFYFYDLRGSGGAV
ncbi:MAG: hypothetical protein HYW01_07695 [Deltaproteobacteria bacterium]|nr:hypothetical protein [Deltaproteobacteria bacterium]